MSNIRVTNFGQHLIRTPTRARQRGLTTRYARRCDGHLTQYTKPLLPSRIFKLLCESGKRVDKNNCRFSVSQMFVRIQPPSSILIPPTSNKLPCFSLRYLSALLSPKLIATKNAVASHGKKMYTLLAHFYQFDTFRKSPLTFSLAYKHAKTHRLRWGKIASQ